MILVLHFTIPLITTAMNNYSNEQNKSLKKKKHTKHVLRFDKVKGEYETWTINLGIE